MQRIVLNSLFKYQTSQEREQIIERYHNAMVGDERVAIKRENTIAFLTSANKITSDFYSIFRNEYIIREASL